MNASDFSWEIACPTPWGNGALVYFDFDDPRVYMAVPARLSPTVARQISQFLSNFSLIAHFCGMRNTISRITQVYVERGTTLEESWLQALLSVQMINQGTYSLITPFLYQYSQFTQEDSEAASFTFQISSLHGWALHESADYLLRDLIPQLQQQGGYPFEKVTELVSQAQSVRAHFRQIADYFSGEKSPYFNLSELPVMDLNRHLSEKV